MTEVKRSLEVQYCVQRVRRGCCRRVVLFLWKRDGWGKAVVGAGHPCTLPQQRSFQARTALFTRSSTLPLLVEHMID